MTVWLTSDLHLGHEKPAHLRGFATVEEHDLAILQNIADTLELGDTLRILGDLSTGTDRAETHALTLLADLTKVFRLELIAGNHDSVHPINIRTDKDADYADAKFRSIFRSVRTVDRRRIPTLKHTKLWFSHFPYFGDGDRDSTEDRHPETRVHDNGHDYLVHGHLHTTEKWTASRSLHIGLDAWDLHPVSLDTVHSLIVSHARTPIAA